MEMSQEALDLKNYFQSYGQGHVFDYYEQLNADQKDQLIEQVKGIRLEELDGLIQSHVLTTRAKEGIDYSQLRPSNYIPYPVNGENQSLWDEAEEIGKQAIQAGRVAAFTVAGGQGTRLGFDGPKGTFEITPISKKSLFEVFADKISRASERFETRIPWFIMTSQLNHQATIELFKTHAFFGFDPELIHFFSQELIPSVDLQGKILLEEPGKIAMAPNGHGGSLRALSKSGSIQRMREQGIDILSYFQVDNPMISCIDPTFVGFHVMNQSELSSKMVAKTYASEKVGLFCHYKESDMIVEYSDLPQSYQEQQAPDGALLYNAGNVAVHLFDRDFIERLGNESSDEKLAFHKAFKKIPYYDAKKGVVQPKQNNGVKFEMFVFDALPKANHSIIVEGLREDTFSPVKNAEGVDSPKSCKDAMSRQALRWLNRVEAEVNSDPSDESIITVEMNFRFAMDESDFIDQWNKLETKPEIKDGCIIGE